MDKHVYLAEPPNGLAVEYAQVFPPPAQQFLVKLHRHFQPQVNQLYCDRRQRAILGQKPGWKASKHFPGVEGDWLVEAVPPVLKDRRLDLGDVSPADLHHFRASLNAHVQGIQVDFDDGHCPSWRNNIVGHSNVKKAVRNQIIGAPHILNSPVLMFRPRAWNMTEHNMVVDGVAIAGALFDFGLHMFHNGLRLYQLQKGPFFYLSKLESAKEAMLWNDIFEWTQRQLNIPIGTIKATVLIEDIMAAFEMEEILYALRQHSAGLNCGIWDYCASIVARFGGDPAFLLPDRNKYVNMDQPFLRNYLELAVKTCTRRGTVATGGMAALLADSSDSIKKVLASKKKEIETGVAGFMVYDIRLVSIMKELWANTVVPSSEERQPIAKASLLKVPTGGVTLDGLTHNIRVTLLFIHHWLGGRGHFVLRGAVEDSATAEISRWQVHQWLQHKVRMEETQEAVTYALVSMVASAVAGERLLSPAVLRVFLRLISLQHPPHFITTYLSDHFINLYHSYPHAPAKL